MWTAPTLLGGRLGLINFSRSVCLRGFFTPNFCYTVAIAETADGKSPFTLLALCCVPSEGSPSLSLRRDAAAAASHGTSCTETRSCKREDSLEDQIVVLKPVVSRRISCEELLRFSNVESRSLVGLEDCGQLRS